MEIQPKGIKRDRGIPREIQRQRQEAWQEDRLVECHRDRKRKAADIEQ